MDLWTLLLALLLLAFGAFAVKGTIKFDLNEYLRDRRKRKEDHLRSMCPHAVFSEAGQGQLAVRGTYISPPGTTAWQCQLCGRWTHDAAQAQEGVAYWAKHPDKLRARQAQISAKAKKLGR